MAYDPSESITKEAQLLDKKRAYLCELFEGDLKDQGPWRKNVATVHEKYYHGEQRTEEELLDLKDKKRAPVVVNEIAPVVDRVLGSALDLDFDWQIIPIPGLSGIGEEEEIAAQAYTGLFEYAKDKSGIEYAMDDVKEDGLVVGRGWVEIAVDNKETIKLLYAPWKEIWWDAYAQDKYLLSDMKHIERAKWVPLNWALKKWPKAAALLKEQYDEAQTPDDVGSEGIIRSTQDYELSADASAKPQYVDKRNKRIRIVEMWYFDGKGTPDKPDGDVRFALFSKKALILDKASPLKVNILPFIPYTVKVDHNMKPYGLVKAMIDLQDVANKRYSKAEFLLDVCQVIYAEGTVKDEETLREQAAQPDGLIALSADAKIGENFMIVRGGEFTAQQYAIFVDAVNRLREVSGVNQEFMGQQTNARSGTAIGKRTQASSNILYRSFRNVKRTWDQLGRYMKEFIEAYYTEEMVIRITNEEDAPQYIELNQDGGQLDLRGSEDRFDLKHVAIPATKDAREREMDRMANIAKTLGPGAFPEEMWIENSQLRFKAKYIKAMRERRKAAAQPTPEQQAKVQKLMAEARRAMAQGGLDEATIQEVLANAGLLKAKTENEQVSTSLILTQLQALTSGVASIKTWIEGQPKPKPEKASGSQKKK